jgi:hypothetical protein
MQARDGTGTRWDSARNRIRQQLDSLTPTDRVALVTTAARTETVAPFSPPSVVAAKLSELTPNHTAGDLAPGLREAVRLLTQAERGPDPSILLVSDLQRDAVQGLDSTPVPPGIDLRVVAIGDLLVPNLSVSDVRLDSGETNRPFATVASHSDEPSKSLEARLSVDGKPVWTRPLALGPGASTNLALDLPPLPQGWHQAEVRLTQDDNLAADNARSAVFYVPPPIRVLLVEGRRGVRSFEEQSFFLAAALDPNAGTTNEIDVANGDGVSANPTLSLPSTVYLGTAGQIGRDSTDLIDFDTDNNVIIRTNNTDNATFSDTTIPATLATATLAATSLSAAALATSACTTAALAAAALGSPSNSPRETQTRSQTASRRPGATRLCVTP